MGKALRVGFVGFGFIGKVHAYAHLTMPLFYDPPPVATTLAAVCTSRPETARAAQERFGFERATDDFRAVTESPDIDIVHITSPNLLHRDHLLSALAAGKHVYCEKPLTVTLTEAREVQRALGSYRGTHQMCLQNRFFPATLRAKQLIDEGFLGQLLGFRAAYLHSGSADPQAPLRWKLDRSMGGGVLLDLGPHVIDLVRLLAGEFAEVLLATSIAYAERPSAADRERTVAVEAEDSALLLVRTRAGALGSIEASKVATGTEDELRLELHGSLGALRFNSMQPNYLETYSRTDPDEPLGGTRGWKAVATVARYPKPADFPGPKFATGWLRSHVACLANFLAAVAAGRKAVPGLEVGVRLQEIMDAARRSAVSSTWVGC
jgi:predicted dehydrogenase